MTRPLLRGAALGGLAIAGLVAWSALRAATPPARPFPQTALPAVERLAPLAAPVAGSTVAATKVAALFLDGDALPDLLAVSAGGEVEGLVNVTGSRPGGAAFEPAPYTRSLGGSLQELLVHDLDADGGHDLAYLVLEDPRGLEPRPRLSIDFASGAGAFAEGRCMPALERVDGYQPVGLGAADADRDGKIDLLLDLAPVIEGTIGKVDAPAPRSSFLDNGDQPGTGGPGGSSPGLPAYTLTDPAARFPRFVPGMRVIADLREGRSFPVVASTPTTLSFAVEGAPGIAAAGGRYRVILPPDRTVVLRGLGERCFAPGWQVQRPVYDARQSPKGTVLLDPGAGLSPANAYAGRSLRYGPAPLAPSAPTVRIVSHTGTELVLDPAAGNLTAKLPGIAGGGVPAVYAILPPSFAPVPASARLRNERSMLELPSGHVTFRAPGSGAAPYGAVADFDADGRADLAIASGQLLIRMHR